MNDIPISTQGFQDMRDELERLKKERPTIIEAIKEAREHGDLKENAEYHAARERQGMQEARISHIESRLPRFNVIDLDSLDGEKAIFGATVEMENIDTEERKIYTLLGPDEADFSKGTISIYSPVGRALLGKEEGDEIVVDAPSGKIEYEILTITFRGSAAINGHPLNMAAIWAVTLWPVVVM